MEELLRIVAVLYVDGNDTKRKICLLKSFNNSYNLKTALNVCDSLTKALIFFSI